MTCMYKDYKFEIKMVQSLWRSNMKIAIYRGEEPLMKWDKNLVGGGYCRRIFSSGVMDKILVYGGLPQ